jgi:hypothetical protein
MQRVAAGMVAWGSGMMACYSGSCTCCTFVVRTLPSVLVHNDQLEAVADAEIKLIVNLTLG